MKKILLIATGGTIASHSGKEGLIPEMQASELLKCVPEIFEFCQNYQIKLCLENVEWSTYNRLGVFSKIREAVPDLGGVLDVKHYGQELERSWVFRTVGYGNNETYWRDLVSNLRLCGYDRVLSIEHEDSVMSIDEGLRKAISFLKDIIIEEEKPTTMSWA